MMLGTTTREIVSRGSMSKPREEFVFPVAQNIANQVQQLRVNTIPTPISTLRTPRLTNLVPSVPKAVGPIHVTRLPILGTNNVRVTVNFQRDPADTAFQSANVYLKQANGTNNLVATTSGTQGSFVVSKTGAASVVTVQSQGIGNALPIQHSPSRAINLI